MGTAMSRAMVDDTIVPKINGTAPYCFVDRVPVAANEKMPAELAQGELRTVCQFVTDKHDEREDGQRHEQREPFEGTVAEMRAGFGGCRFQIRFRRSRGNEAQISSKNHFNSEPPYVGSYFEKSKGRRAGGTAPFVRLTPIKLSCAGAKSVFYCFNPLQNALLHTFRQGA